MHNRSQDAERSPAAIKRPSKILLVDDHPLFVAGFAYILSDLLGDVELLQASTAATARVIEQANPDLDWVFCDYKLPDSNGLSLLRDFKKALLTAPVILVSAFEDIGMIDEALMLGASGFIPKSADKLIFQQCLQHIEQGLLFLLPETHQQLAQYRNHIPAEKRRVTSRLSRRQFDVLQLIAGGYSNLEIGQALGITESTVKSHVSSLLSLLDTDNRAHCVAEARRLQLIA